MERALLEQRNSAGLLGLLRDVRLVEAGHEDHARLGTTAAQALRRLDPVHFRHADVDDCDLGAAVDGELDRSRPVTGRPDDVEPVVVTEQECERVDEETVVVDDHNANWALPEVSGQGLDPEVYEQLPVVALSPNT